MATQPYTATDVRLGTVATIVREGGTIVHTHRVLFARPPPRRAAPVC